MPKVDLAAIEQTRRTGYPAPFNKAVAKRLNRYVGKPLALEDFGVTETTLEPGGWSSQRHWHEQEDEIVVMIEGEAILVEEASRTRMITGDAAVFPKGVANGHHFVNESDRICRFFAIGRPAQADCHYPDIDMHLDGTAGSFVRKDGSAF